MITPRTSWTNSTDEAAVLTCWKDIARYMGKGVRTVQRWEQGLGLPVRRPLGVTHKSAVLASREDLDAWMASRWSRRRTQDSGRPTAAPVAVHQELTGRIQTAQELRTANHALIMELHQALQTLVERCDHLARAEGLIREQAAMPRPHLTQAPSCDIANGSSSKRIA